MMQTISASAPATTYSPKKTSFIAGLTASVALLIIGYFLLFLSPPNGTLSGSAAAELLLPSPVAIYPKPGDKFVFLGLVLLTPFVIAAVALAARRLNITTPDPSYLVWLIVSIAGFTLLWRSPQLSLTLFDNGRWAWSTLCIVGAASLVALPNKKQDIFKRAIIPIAFVASALLLAGLRVWTADAVAYKGPFSSHYEAVISAAVRISAGGTCLADVLPQYGCYGEFLKPLFGIFGTSTVAVTSVFVLLQIAAVWATLIFSFKLIRAMPLLLGCILCLFIWTVLNMRPEQADPILQYYPVRFLFPAASLIIVSWLQRHLTWKRALLAGVFGGAAIAWNLESGLAVTIALAAFILLGNVAGFDATDRLSLYEAGVRAAGRVASFVAGTVSFLAMFVCYLSIQSGGAAELSNYAVFQTTFYQTGFGMIPIPPFPDYWTIHAAIILSVLVLLGISIGAGKTSHPELERAAYLATLSIGLSLYYSGRSHPMVLRLVTWPDIILFFFIADQAVRMSVGKLERTALSLLQVCTVAVPAAYLVMAGPSVRNLLGLYFHPSLETVGPVEQDIRFIRAHTAKDEPVAIVAINQGTLYGETGTRSALAGPGVAEMIRRGDWERQQNVIIENGPDKVFLGTGLETAADSQRLGTNLTINLRNFRRAYALEAWGPGQRLMYLRRKPFAGRDLFEE